MEDEIVVRKDNTIKLPKRFWLSPEKRRLVIKTPYSVCVKRLTKDDVTVAMQMFFRQEGKEKPYVPKDSVMIDGKLFKCKFER